MQKLRYYFLVLLLCTTASQNADLFVHSAHIETENETDLDTQN